MVCPHCQTINPDGARFCMNCGKSLSTACPNCGTQNPLDARFCLNCGIALAEKPAGQSAGKVATGPLSDVVAPSQAYTQKWEAARSSHSMEGERRIVTILFCDVSGSTAMAEGMDPEEWAGIMNQAFSYLIAPVYRYEGTVARLMGDAILAFFGAPIAHEDDPQRAILAGLEILSGVQEFSQGLKEKYGVDFNLRVGINTGLVVVGSVGSDLVMEYTAMGDAVNLAARMEQTAQPGTLQITEDTYKSVAVLFDVEPLGGIEVKGKKEPVQAYRVLRQRPDAVPIRGIQGLRSPLVGRAGELATLQARIQKLLEGRGQIVAVIGEAGLGKSRLVAELHHWLEAEGFVRPGHQGQTASLGWFEGRSLSYETTTPYAPFIDLFTGLLDLSPSGGPIDDRYRLIQSRVREVGGHSEFISPFLAALLGIYVPGEDAERVKYLSPPQLRERIIRAVLDYLEILASHQNLVLVFEDLHWVDAASLDLIEKLLKETEKTPLMILALFRPNRQDSSWRFHELGESAFSDRYTAIELQPLKEDQARALVANLLEIEDLPQKVRELILRKAEGNPFYVEEVIRSLIDSKLVLRLGDHWQATRDIEKISVPNTLAGVITARLDRLDETARRTTQEAAVIGREFPMDVLSAVHQEPDDPAGPSLEQALQTLQYRELVREKTRQPLIYTFKHVLTQETAYSSLLLSRRRELHGRVASYLAENQPDHAGEIARHYLEAMELKRALPYLIDAGDRAARTYSTKEAISYYRQAIEILPQAEDVGLARRAYEGFGRALTFANQVGEAVANYQAMYAAGGQRENIPMQVSALNKLSDLVAMRMGQFPEAEKLLLDAEDLARRFDDKAGLAELFMVRCSLCTARGDFQHAVSYLGESVEIASSLDQKADMALGLSHIANTQVYMTMFDQAWDTAQHSLQISREIRNRELQSEVLSLALPLIYLCRGDYRAAYESAQEGAQVAAEIGASLAECFGATSCSRVCLETGDFERALQWANQSAAAGQEYGMPFMVAMGLCTEGALYLEIGQELKDKIAEAHGKTLELIDLPGGSMAGGMAWSDLGFCALALGDPDRASGYFQKGLDIPSPFSLLNRPRFLVGLAMVAQTKGDLAEAQEHLDQARQFAAEKGMKNYPPLIELVQGQLYLARGELPQAIDRFRQSEQAAVEMGLRPMVYRARMGIAGGLDQLGQTAEAERMRSQAEEVILEIAGLFSTPDYRQIYLEGSGIRMPVI